MKTLTRILALCVLGLSTSANYAAAQEVIRCDFNAAGTRGWVSGWAYVHTDPTGAHVFDGSTWTTAKGAVVARELKRKSKGQRYEWSLNLQPTGQKNLRVKYLLTVSNDPKKKSSLAATIANRRVEHEFARGECLESTPTPKAEFLRWAEEQVAKG